MIILKNYMILEDDYLEELYDLARVVHRINEAAEEREKALGEKEKALGEKDKIIEEQKRIIEALQKK